MEPIKISKRARIAIIIIASLLFFIMLESCTKEPSAHVDITRFQQSSYPHTGYIDTLGVFHDFYTDSLNNPHSTTVNIGGITYPIISQPEFGLIDLHFEIYNNGYYTIDDYKILFTALLEDGTYVEEEYWGTNLNEVGHGEMDIETGGKRAVEVVVTNLDLY